MIKKEKLEDKEVEDLTKEDNEKNTINIELQEGEEIDGEVVKELISPRYEEKTSCNYINESLSYKYKGKESSIDSQIIKKRANSRTPAIDGEEFDTRRTYIMRKSTVKMVNQLKAMSDDVNLHMNTIVDTAIRYYFNSVVEDEKNKLYLTKKK